MKRIVSLVLSVGFVIVLMTIASCGGGGTTPVPVTDQQLQKLIGTTSAAFTWKLSSATLDGVDKTSDYGTSFTLSFSGTIGASPATTTFNYTTTKPTVNLSPWPRSGTFTFDTASPSTKVTRDASGSDPVSVTYTVSDTQLQVSFQYSGIGYATRSSVVKGLWVYNFTK